ncbi:HNH endonuclease [Candidatus Woesearchaeota archaeon]|nr:HNH endonuclease [Candidatus Woesearchaeota archaeon]
MSLLTEEEKKEIIRRRHCISDGDKEKHSINSLQIHHKDRNPNNNDPTNLRVLTKQEHKALHKRYGR